MISSPCSYRGRSLYPGTCMPVTNIGSSSSRGLTPSSGLLIYVFACGAYTCMQAKHSTHINQTKEITLLRQGLTMSPKCSSNPGSFCFSLLNARPVAVVTRSTILPHVCCCAAVTTILPTTFLCFATVWPLHRHWWAAVVMSQRRSHQAFSHWDRCLTAQTSWAR